MAHLSGHTLNQMVTVYGLWDWWTLCKLNIERHVTIWDF